MNVNLILNTIALTAIVLGGDEKCNPLPISLKQLNSHTKMAIAGKTMALTVKLGTRVYITNAAAAITAAL
jgi:hypothetical protein